MIQVKNSTIHYINERALTFSENDLNDPMRVAVSLVSGTVIMAYVPGTIDYAADGNYERWTLKGYSTKLINDAAHYIYARLSRTDRTALIVFSVKDYNVDGSITTVTGKDENGNDITETTDPSADYFYIKIGELTATDGTSNRELTYDSGLLSTKKGDEESSLLHELWELIKGTNPLIRAKYWLTDFVVKGFITLIGGFKFSKGKDGDEKSIVDIKRSVDSDEDVPISDESVPTTAYVRSISDDRYLKKYEEDETNYRIKFYDGIEAGHYVKGMIGGSGTRFDGLGYGEMNGLTLREFLEVPELRFNRIDVVSGELWNSIAFGLVESVDTVRRICRIKLEDKERCGLQVYDICRGIFADFGEGTQWEGVDECGFMHMYGFWTSYFTPTKILENRDGVFSFQYELKSGDTHHPAPSMKFAVYGNFLDASRQASAYSTRTYKRYLNNVNTWVIDPDKHIYAQYGDLEGLTIGGMTMHGYGSFQSNSYFTGVQIQFTKEQKEELQGESAYSVVLSDYEGIVIVDDEGNVIGGEMELMNVVSGKDNVIRGDENVVTLSSSLQTQVQAAKGSSILSYSPTIPSEGHYTIAINAVGCEAVVLNGSVIVNSVFYAERCNVKIAVNCEGKSTFVLSYRVSAIRDGKNPVIADIDNEMDSVACDSKGKVLFGLPVSCTVSMWAGVKPLDIEKMDVAAPDGVSVTTSYIDQDGNDLETLTPEQLVEVKYRRGVVSVLEGGILDDAANTLPIRITAYAQYGGTLYHKVLVFTVNKVVAGENALLYKLSPSVSSVKVDAEGVMTADSVRCEVVASDGEELSVLAELPEDLSMKRFLDKEAAQDYIYNSPVEINDGNDTVTFQLFWKEKLIDVETIPILLDGSTPVFIDLDNEMFSVACNEEGEVVFMPEMVSSANMYWGDKNLDTEVVSVDAPEGVEVSFSGNRVSVLSISREVPDTSRISVTAKATHRLTEYTRTAHITINKIRQGQSTWVLDLLPSVSAVKVDGKGRYTPVSVSCRTRLMTGKDSSVPEALQDNYIMKYSVDASGEKPYSYGSEIPVSPEYDKEINGLETDVTFLLYFSRDNGEESPWVLVDKETVPVLRDAANTFKSTVFIRTNEKPDTPSGGSYESPEPTSFPKWHDGIPPGEEILWASVCTFSSDGASSGWSEPSQMTDTASFDVEFSSVETNPGTPDSNPANWSNEASEDTIWMATRTLKNGVWSNWQVTKIKGEKGETGEKGEDAVSEFKSTVFIRTNEEPDTPSGGSYESPEPTSLPKWWDGIPPGEEILWASVCTFSSDGASSGWSEPSQMTDTASFDVEFSSVETNPGTPDSNPENWSNEASEDTIWMATRTFKNGIWSSWQVTKIKGERGEKSISEFKSTVFIRTNEEPDTPSGGSYESPEPTSLPKWHDGIPPGEEILWASVCTFSSDGASSGWSKPSQMTDTASFDVEFSSVETDPGTPESNPENWSNDVSEDTIWIATRTFKNGAWDSWQVTKIKGEKGDNAMYYEIRASVGSIGFTATGRYSPSSFIVSEYTVDGASRTPSNRYYIHVYGLKEDSVTHLEYTSSVNRYTFNASSYASDNYDAFRFDLRKGSSQSSSLVSADSTTTVAVARDGSNEAAGSMPYNCGEYSSSTRYYYNADRRDIVTYEREVYMVRVFDADGYIIDKLPTDETCWIQASKDIFRAMDTALIDGANIAGFTFKNNVMQSQTGTLTLDGVNGEITALAGHIGDWELSDGKLKTYGTYEGSSFNNSYTNTLDSSGMDVSLSDGLISASFGINNTVYNKEGATFFSALVLKNAQSLSIRRTDPMCGVYIEGNYEDLGIFSKGPSNQFLPDSGGSTLINGLRLRSRSVSGPTTLDTVDDNVVVTRGTVSLPHPATCPGKMYFIKVIDGSVSVPRMTGTNSSSVDSDTTSITSSAPRIFISAPVGGGYSWIEYYCRWD